jgi:DNA-nicking Smr family endonuclease
MTNGPKERRDLPEDRALWRDAVRGVAPLRRRDAAAMPPLPPGGPPASARNEAPRGRQTPAADSPAGIDRATAQRLKRGLRKIEARLDLHGMTQREAHRALAEFIRASHAAGRRCLLVITGRGLGADGPGTLKSAVPRWLGEGDLGRQILAVAAAQPRHGGAGALYVLLRRRR